MQSIFNEAIKRNEPKKVYLKMTDIYIRNGKLEVTFNLVNCWLICRSQSLIFMSQTRSLRRTKPDAGVTNVSVDIVFKENRHVPEISASWLGFANEDFMTGGVHVGCRHAGSMWDRQVRPQRLH